MKKLHSPKMASVTDSAQPVLFPAVPASVSPSAQKKIFEPFERLHRQDGYEGTGIGLAIVQKAVQRMGGRVGVESTEGGGSRFWVELQGAPPL
jgi:signal transduction histidine kinase